MMPEIASLHERMAKGGDWRIFRDEIAALHAQAKTEEEFVTLLEAHKNLVAVGKFAFDEETLLNKLGFPCDIRSDPAQRMMHITVHLTGAVPAEGLRTAKEADLAGNGSRAQS
jgi:hypothetical protein